MGCSASVPRGQERPILEPFDFAYDGPMSPHRPMAASDISKALHSVNPAGAPPGSFHLHNNIPAPSFTNGTKAGVTFASSVRNGEGPATEAPAGPEPILQHQSIGSSLKDGKSPGADKDVIRFPAVNPSGLSSMHKAGGPPVVARGAIDPGRLSSARNSYHGDSLQRDDYELNEEIGTGASAKVWRATKRKTGETLAVKELDLEFCASDLEDIKKETIVMRNMQHPNLVPYWGSFVHEHYLWVLMPLLDGGSATHVMKWGFPDGFDEIAIATIMREVLKGLEYLHAHGSIHRDIKAGNIILDEHGNVFLGDFGVSACVMTGANAGAATTFVGTPCWMAPEVIMNQYKTKGYDFHADIWSIGITMLELAHGHAPFARYEPMKVMQMILKAEPPTLDGEASDNKTFSQSMRDIVAACLQKDPLARPTAAKLLKHPFFKAAKGPEYVHQHLLNPEILQGLSLAERVRKMEENDKRKMRFKLDMADAAAAAALAGRHETDSGESKAGIEWNFGVDHGAEGESSGATLPAGGAVAGDADSSATLRASGSLGDSTAGARAVGHSRRGSNVSAALPATSWAGDAAIMAAASAPSTPAPTGSPSGSTKAGLYFGGGGGGAPELDLPPPLPTGATAGSSGSFMIGATTSLVTAETAEALARGGGMLPPIVRPKSGKVEVRGRFAIIDSGDDDDHGSWGGGSGGGPGLRLWGRMRATPHASRCHRFT